jgi:hypothetical protein
MSYIKVVFMSKFAIIDEILNSPQKPHSMFKTKPINDDLALIYTAARLEFIEHSSVVVNTKTKKVVASLADNYVSLPFEIYQTTFASNTDLFVKGYEGTMIYVYNHDDTWHYGTADAANVDRAYTDRPNITYGMLLDDALRPIVGGDGDMRAHFAQKLAPDKIYCFKLVHHASARVMDYTPEFGKDYAFIIHIYTRDKETCTIDYTDFIEGYEGLIKYPVLVMHEDVADMTTDRSVYAVIVRTVANKVIKLCNPAVDRAKNEYTYSLNNPWVKFVSVYTKGDAEYKISDYINEYHLDSKNSFTLVDANGARYDPTYIVHEVVRGISEQLYADYRNTTFFRVNWKGKRSYSVDEAKTNALTDLYQYHMTKLRKLQFAKAFDCAPLTPKNIRENYVCKLGLKHFRLLVDAIMFTRSANPQLIKERITQCFVFLHDKLR